MLTHLVSVPSPCNRSGTQKDPGRSAKSAGGRLHLNSYSLDPTEAEWADYTVVQI